jgi:hypothetical protein
MRFIWILLVALLMTAGCSSQEYGQCEAPNDNLKVMFKPKLKAHPFSHSFCIVCNTDLEPEGYDEWAIEMGAPQGTNNMEGILPCLYVYRPDGSEQETDSLEICEALVCGGEAEYSDMVNEKNGNFNLDPILDPDALVVQEEWILAEESQSLISFPADRAVLRNPDTTFHR